MSDSPIVIQDMDQGSKAQAAKLGAFYAGRRVLVAGADGFLGVNLLHALHALGARVSILSRRAAPRADGFDGTVFYGDLRDAAIVRSAAADQEVVFDFAGATGPLDSNQAPLQNIESDVVPHLSLIRACAETPSPPLLVFCSSRLVYGPPQYLPVDECHPLHPGSIYAAHKITIENYLRVFRQTHGLHSCTVRLSNPYGRNDALGPKTYGVINRFIQLAMEKKPITIYGDGGQLRDYIHIDDALMAFLSIAAQPRCRDEVFNFGGNSPMRIRDTVALIASAAGGTRIEFVPWPKDSKCVETGDYYTDLRKLADFVDLPPQVSFVEGLRRTMRTSEPHA